MVDDDVAQCAFRVQWRNYAASCAFGKAAFEKWRNVLIGPRGTVRRVFSALFKPYCTASPLHVSTGERWPSTVTTELADVPLLMGKSGDFSMGSSLATPSRKRATAVLGGRESRSSCARVGAESPLPLASHRTSKKPPKVMQCHFS